MDSGDKPVLRKAVRLLTIRARSEAEMRRRLAPVGEAESVEKVVDKLRSLKYLDDAELARNLAEKHLLRAHHGPFRAKLEMERAGLSADLVQTALADVLAEHPVSEILALALHKETRGQEGGSLDLREYRRLFDRLARRGFEPEAIREALEPFRRGDES